MFRLILILVACIPTILLGISLPSAPPNPLTPPANGSNLPIVLQNGSGQDDGDVYVVMTCSLPLTSTNAIVSIDGSGVGSLVTIDKTVWEANSNASDYTVKLNALNSLGSQPYNGGNIGNYCFYIPQLSNGLIWFSIGQSLTMPVVDGNGYTYTEAQQKGPTYQTIPPYSLRQPSFSDSGDPNYPVTFDIFEVAYVSTAPNIDADATAVSFFSIPLYGYISTPNAGSKTYTGIYYPQAYAFSQIGSFFNSSKESSQWNNLILKEDGAPLRVISTGKGMVELPDGTILFDQNYLDNTSAYGYSYIDDIWKGTSSFIRRNQGNINLKIPISGGITFTLSDIDTTNKLTFTATGQNPVYFTPPVSTFPTTSFNIFSGVPLCSDPSDANAIQVSKLFAEAIICSVFPTTSLLNGNDYPYLEVYKKSYYTVNSNLSSGGQTTGPWYCLYSQALHSLGAIYSYAYDEPIWPEVQISSDTLESNTYLGVTIGSLEAQPTTQITMSASVNPVKVSTPVVISAKVEGGDSGTPTGGVEFSVDGGAGTTVSLVSGIATFNTTFTETGIHSVTAHYLGDSSYLESTSPPFSVFVSSTSTASVTSLSSKSTFDSLGQTVNLSALVQSGMNRIKNLGRKGSSPQGSVVFTINKESSDHVVLEVQQAEYSLLLSPGKYRVLAEYSGDSNYVTSVDKLKIVVSPVHPPVDGKIRQTTNQFATQTDVINVLTWTKPSSGVEPVSYRIYEDKKLKKLVGKIGAKSKHLLYRDHDRKKGKRYRYYIVSEDREGNLSEPAKLSID